MGSNPGILGTVSIAIDLHKCIACILGGLFPGKVWLQGNPRILGQGVATPHNQLYRILVRLRLLWHKYKNEDFSKCVNESTCVMPRGDAKALT